jgi:hypothetical protein
MKPHDVKVCTMDHTEGPASLPGIGFCQEKRRLQQAFLNAVRELVEIEEQQSQAVIAGDADFARFDILIHMANEQKDNAKYAWISHVESHRCEEA